MSALRLRTSEWVLVAFFAYVAALVPFFPERSRFSYQPFLILALVLAVDTFLARRERDRAARTVSMIRDWLPLGLLLVAFREMEIFVTKNYNHRFESAWAHWDAVFLNDWRWAHWYQASAPVLPLYFELCYFLVYGLGFYCITIVWLRTGRKAVDRFYVVYLTGTLLAYALFPFFPSRPPRIAFPDLAMPTDMNLFRLLNLYVLSKGTIHVGVFPSAHVSSAFSAVWGMFLVMPKGRRGVAWGLLIYAVSVSLATIFGRYHYATDVIAGFMVSLAAASLCLVFRARDRKMRQPELAYGPERRERFKGGVADRVD